MDLEDIAKAASAKRVMHEFDVPSSLHTHGIKTLGLVELTPREQTMASSRAGLDPMAIANEYAKESLRMVNGAPVSTADGSVDKAWERMHPKIRTLVTTAYNDLHSTSNVESEDFLQSRRAVVR